MSTLSFELNNEEFEKLVSACQKSIESNGETDASWVVREETIAALEKQVDLNLPDVMSALTEGLSGTL